MTLQNQTSRSLSKSNIMPYKRWSKLAPQRLKFLRMGFHRNPPERTSVGRILIGHESAVFSRQYTRGRQSIPKSKNCWPMRKPTKPVNFTPLTFYTAFTKPPVWISPFIRTRSAMHLNARKLPSRNLSRNATTKTGWDSKSVVVRNSIIWRKKAS